MTKNNKGFTLIETLVYLGLLGIMMAGLLASTFSILQNTGRTQTKAMIQEEGSFLLAKLNWALINAETITQPNSNGSALVLTKYDNSTIQINLDTDNNLQLSRDGGIIWLPLNNSNTSLTALTFTHTGAVSSPESITASFTLETKTPTGQIYSQDFTTTKYLRK